MSATPSLPELDFRRKDLADHVLTLLATNAAQHLYVYDLSKPGDCIHANVIVFSRHGIVIHGDTCFGDHDQGMGVTGGRGKGPAWFAGNLSEGYLAEKFLRQNNWSAKRAAAELHDEADCLEQNGNYEATVNALEVIADDLEGGGITAPHELYERLDDADLNDWFEEELPGYGYDENALGWLVAIQRRFAELYRADAEPAERDGAEGSAA